MTPALGLSLPRVVGGSTPVITPLSPVPNGTQSLRHIQMAKRDQEREARFARLVAIDGLTYLAAFCESASGYAKPEPNAAARVRASRYAARTTDLRAELAKQKADAAAPVEVSTEPQAILRLMDEVSQALLQASKVAKAHGANRLANTLRQSLTRHVGHQSRVSQRVENPGGTKAADADGVEEMALRIFGLPA